MLNVIIVDDELLARENLRCLLDKIAKLILSQNVIMQWMLYVKFIG